MERTNRARIKVKKDPWDDNNKITWTVLSWLHKYENGQLLLKIRRTCLEWEGRFLSQVQPSSNRNCTSVFHVGKQENVNSGGEGKKNFEC